MDSSRRKAEVTAFKGRNVAAGIYVVRCAATAEQWVGRAPDIDTVWRRLTFELGLGGCRLATLQAAWRAHGSGAFSFEVLKRIEEEIDLYPRQEARRPAGTLARGAGRLAAHARSTRAA